MPRNTNGGSSTVVVEPSSLIPLENISQPSSTKNVVYVNEGARTLSSTPPPPEGQLPSPISAHPQLTRWNDPKINIYRLLASLWSFILLGTNDAAYGALIPYLETYYNVNYTVISLVFLSPTFGYVLSALTNNWVHVKSGQRGVAIVMSVCHMTAYAIISIHPPYPVLVLVFALSGYGNGLGDSAWNAWIGDMANPNELLGILHACYGLGGALAPLIATTVITKAGWQWYEFYYLMVGAAAIECITLTTSFWKADGAAFRAQHQSIEEADSGASTPTRNLNDSANTTTAKPPQPWFIRMNPFLNPKSRTAEAMRNRITLLVAGFLLLYVGAEVTLGGWLVTFMLRVRGADPFAAGLSSTGFWLGVTVGRLVLGFVTPRLFKSEKWAIATYLLACVALQLMFWLIPRFIVSAVLAGLLGFFLAPMFPAGVVALTKLLPKRLHVASIGFCAALGASGACIFPFATGAIANAKGVQVLQPIVLAMLAAVLGLWLLIPTLPKQRIQ